MLSRPHLRIARAADDDWVVDDLGSRNGTFVDGRLVHKPTRLTDGNVVLFGGHVGVYRRVAERDVAAIEEEAASPLGPVPTLSPELAGTAALLRRLKDVDTHLLLVGETGVGKEIYARAVHAAAKRKGPFIAINCAALPFELAESELFGYARGAHSTATRAKEGLVELADGGTVLLDEIGDMAPRLQVKLFRFLQDRQVTALGSTRARPVDVRVIAATSQVSEAMRADLVGRLGAEPIVIPPLRERPEDIGALVAHLSAERVGGFEPAAFRALCLYDWPRNVRELDEVLRRAGAMAGAAPIAVDDLPGKLRAVLDTGPRVRAARRWRAAPSRAELERLLKQNRGNVSAVAKALDRQWAVVNRWLHRHDLVAERFRE
jgi:transcriptional regulator with PAS, ATPase and Fis domain